MCYYTIKDVINILFNITRKTHKIHSYCYYKHLISNTNFDAHQHSETMGELMLKIEHSYWPIESQLKMTWLVNGRYMDPTCKLNMTRRGFSELGSSCWFYFSQTFVHLQVVKTNSSSPWTELYEMPSRVSSRLRKFNSVIFTCSRVTLRLSVLRHTQMRWTWGHTMLQNFATFHKKNLPPLINVLCVIQAL